MQNSYYMQLNAILYTMNNNSYFWWFSGELRPGVPDWNHPCTAAPDITVSRGANTGENPSAEGQRCEVRSSIITWAGAEPWTETETCRRGPRRGTEPQFNSSEDEATANTRSLLTDARLWAPTERAAPEGPWDAEELGAAHMHTHTDGDATERVSRSTLKVEFAFTAIRQLEDKWLNAFGGKEERLPPQRTGEWLTAGWRETPGNINSHLTNTRLTVLNRVYQGNTLAQ